jgi:hypothetical protein
MTIIKAGTKACELCGKIDELRPYGANGEWICFKCAMKDEATTSARFGAILEKGGLVIDLMDQDGEPEVTP